MACAEELLRRLDGASVRRVIDRGLACVPEHAHAWPVLSLFVIGGYVNQTELGRMRVAGPSAILYRAGAAHQNTIASQGFEQIEIEFDPAWLGTALLPTLPISRWIGGRAGGEARTLVRLCNRAVGERQFRAAVRRFVETASREPARDHPDWVDTVARRLHENTASKARDLARDVGRHPSWLGTAYRRATGEGLMETAARFRVERAVHLLRESEQASASIALAAGFCDQSHMNRTIRRVLGRSPSIVREERQMFRQTT